jgi:hypothetical protein
VRRPGIVRPNCARLEESSRGERGAFERTAGGARRREGEAMGEKEKGEGERGERRRNSELASIISTPQIQAKLEEFELLTAIGFAFNMRFELDSV